MYFYIKGTLVETTLTYVVLEARGVGYQLFIPSSALGKLVPLGSEQLLYTSFLVREQSQTLVGFPTKEERELFELLITISGIGSKTALALMGHLTQEDLIHAVQQNDLLLLCKVPGIGKKSAEKIILELKSKLKELLRAHRPGSTSSPVLQDALTALMNLGYSQTKAETAIEKARLSLPSNADLSLLLSTALRSN